MSKYLQILALVVCVVTTIAAMIHGQELPEETGPVAADVQTNEVGDLTGSTKAVGTSRRSPDRLNPFKLVLKGGWMMILIGLMSVLVVAFSIERAIALRRFRIMPVGLVDELGELGDAPAGFDPRDAYRICQKYPSAAATVVRSMLMKIGRPHSEVEQAVGESGQREADRLYDNVRWLNLAAAVTPLMGLLGTVWGMIQAFFVTTRLEPGQNKADFLAEGIYVALVTTLGGLIVAIPAAILAHYFEGRIQRVFHQIDELLFNMLPQIERYEGRVRVSLKQLQTPIDQVRDGDQKTSESASPNDSLSAPEAVN